MVLLLRLSATALAIAVLFIGLLFLAKDAHGLALLSADREKREGSIAKRIEILKASALFRLLTECALHALYVGIVHVAQPAL